MGDVSSSTSSSWTSASFASTEKNFSVVTKTIRPERTRSPLQIEGCPCVPPGEYKKGLSECYL